MSVGVTLLVAGVVVPLASRRRHRRWVLGAGLLLVVAGLVHDLAPLVDLAPVGAALERVRLPGLVDMDGTTRLLVLAALVWCGPAADLVVRGALDATRLPAPEAAAEPGLRAGRWIGRLERWLLVVTIVSGQAALAVLPVGGKALFRYAEVVAEARVEAPRLQRADTDRPPVTRSTLVDYVIVGSLASWVQAIGLALLAA